MDEAAITRIEELLKETLELAEENNELLHSLKRNARRAFWGKLLVWIILLVVPLLVLAPVIHAIMPLIYSSGAGETGTGAVFSFPSPAQIQGILSAYKSASTTP